MATTGGGNAGGKDRESLQQWAESKREELDDLYIATRLDVERQVRQLREDTMKREEEMRRELWSDTNRHVDQLRDQYEHEYIEKKVALESLIKLKFHELELELQKEKEVPKRESDPTRRKHRHRTKRSHTRTRGSSNKLDRCVPVGGKAVKSPELTRAKLSQVKVRLAKSRLECKCSTSSAENYSIRSDHSQIVPKMLAVSASELLDPSTSKSSRVKPSTADLTASKVKSTLPTKNAKSQPVERMSPSKDEPSYRQGSPTSPRVKLPQTLQQQQQQIKTSPSNMTNVSKSKSRAAMEMWKRWERWP